MPEMALAINPCEALDTNVLRWEQFWRAMNASEALVEISTEAEKASTPIGQNEFGKAHLG
jgi:hypothetical protein